MKIETKYCLGETFIYNGNKYVITNIVAKYYLDYKNKVIQEHSYKIKNLNDDLDWHSYMSEEWLEKNAQFDF